MPLELVLAPSSTCTLSLSNTSGASVSVSTATPALAVSLATILRGEKGADGAGSDGTVLRTGTAAAALSGHRAVQITGAGVAYASQDDSASARACVGITTGAVASGGTVTIATFGKVTEPSWAWTAGPVYLGVDGLLTQTPPTTGSLVEVGIAVSATQLEVRIQPAINLI